MTSNPGTSPFTPGQPAPLELFVGRRHELHSLLRHAGEAADGRLKVGFLTGDRGIGKTSLARFATFLAERDHKLLGLHVILGGATCADDMVQRVFERLANVARERPLWDRIGQLFGDRIRNVGAFGLQVEFRPKPEDLDSITDSFDQALRSVIERFGEDEHRGLFIVLDDVNGLAGSSTFATWLKNFVDTVAINWESFPVFLLFVGSERIRRELVSHNESAARIFIPFEVSNWSPDETRAFYRRAFEKVGMTVGESACQLMADFTGGLPVLAHEIGDAAFRFANEPVISESDATAAVVRAANVVGHKYFAPQVFDRVRSARYRSLLRRIPQEAPSGRFKRSDILSVLDAGERASLDNFLRVMRQIDVLERDPDRGPGHYRFTSNLHFLYLLLRGTQPL